MGLKAVSHGSPREVSRKVSVFVCTHFSREGSPSFDQILKGADMPKNKNSYSRGT